MKLVIEISERVVHHVKINYMDISENDYAMICDAVRTATPYEESPQWIPCSERLPEEYHTYLVTKLDPSHSRSTFTTLAYFYTEETGWDIDDVIAWMPFPKPYREAGEENGQTN